MKKRNYSDETVKRVSKILENENILWNLFVKGAKQYSKLPGKNKIEEFERIKNLKININEFLDIYKLNSLFVGGKEEEHVSISEESLDKAVKFIEKSPSVAEMLDKNIDFIWNICLLSHSKNLDKKEEFKDIANTMQKQIDSCLKNYKNFNQIAIEKKFSEIAKVFRMFETFEVNFKKEEEKNRRDSLNRANNQKEQKISPEFEQNDENSQQKQKNTEFKENDTKYSEKKKKISSENRNNVENNEEEEKICPKDSNLNNQDKDNSELDKKDFIPKIKLIVDAINQLFGEYEEKKPNSFKCLNNIIGKEEFSGIDPFEFFYISLKRLKINIQVLMTANIKSTEEFQTERKLKEKEVLVSTEKIEGIQRNFESEKSLQDKVEKLKTKLKEKSDLLTKQLETEKILKEQLEAEKQKNEEFKTKIEKMNSKHKEELNKKDNILYEREIELEKIQKKLKEQEKQKTKEIQDLNTQYDTLYQEKKEDEDKIKSKDSEIKKQKKILSDKDQLIQKSEIEMTDLKAKNQTHLKEKEDLIKELNSYKDKFDNLKKLHEGNLLKLSAQEKEISRLNEKKIRLDKAFEEFKTAKNNEIEEKTDTINQMQQRIQEQNISLENNEKIIQEQCATISENKKKIQELDSSCEEKEKNVQQLFGENKKLASNIKDFQEKLKILIAEKKTNEATISDQANQIKELQTEKESLAQEVESLNKVKSNLKNEIENLKEEKNLLKKENKDLEGKKNELKKQNEDLEETTTTLQKKLKREKKAFETETSNLKTALTDEQAAKNELESKYLKYKEKYQNVNQEFLAFKSHFHLGEEVSPPKKSHNNKKKEKLHYDMIINIDSLRSHDMGWEITLNDESSDLLNSSLGNQTLIGFVGRENIGKTYILNKICGFELPSGSNVNTKGLSVKLSNNNNMNLVCLDSAGIQTPVYYFEEKLLQRFNVSKEELKKNDEIKRQMINDRTITDVFIQDFILDVCEVIIVVVGQLSQNDQKFIERIAWKYQAKKRIIVIHNFSNLLAVSDVKDKIQRDIIKAFDATPQIKHTSKNKEMTSYIEKTSKPNCENITHLVLGVDWSDSGKMYNEPTFEYLNDVLETRTDKKLFDLIPRLQEFFKENYRLYLKFKRLPQKEVKLEFDKKNMALVINADEEFEVSNPIFNSLGSLVTNPPYDVIERKELYIVLIEIPDLILDSLQFTLDRKKSEFNCLIVVGEKNINDMLESKKNLGVVGNRNHGQFKCLIPLGPNSYIIKLKDRKVGYENGILKVEVRFLTEENEDLN